MIILATLSEIIISSREKYLVFSPNQNFRNHWLWKFVFSYARTSLYLFSYDRKRRFRIYSHKAWISQNLEFWFNGHSFGRIQIFYKDIHDDREKIKTYKQRKTAFLIWGEKSIHRSRCTQAERACALTCLVPRSDLAGRCTLNGRPPQSPGGPYWEVPGELL